MRETEFEFRRESGVKSVTDDNADPNSDTSSLGVDI